MVTAAIGSYLRKFAVVQNREISEELIAIYVEALEDLELRRIEKGLKAYLQEGTRWPWPGELREYIEDEV